MHKKYENGFSEIYSPSNHRSHSTDYRRAEESLEGTEITDLAFESDESFIVLNSEVIERETRVATKEDLEEKLKAI